MLLRNKDQEVPGCKFHILSLQAKERTWVNGKLITTWHQNS